MLISEEKGFSAKTFFSWQFLMFKVLLLVILAMVLEKPTGSLAGRISLGKTIFGLHTYDIRGNHVYAVVEGPREGQSVERGVWVNDDGTFKFDHLPVGEYQLRVRAKGYESAERYGLFVQEAKVAKVADNIALDVLQPSVSLGQTTRVFTTEETPVLSLRTTDAIDAEIKLYKVDFLKFRKKITSNDSFYCSDDLSLYRRNDTAKGEDPLSKQTPYMVKHYTVALDYLDAGRTNVDFGKLPAGDYVAYVEAQAVNGPKKANNACWFSVSNLGLIVKSDGVDALVRAVDLVSLKPVAGCKIKGLDGSEEFKNSLAAVTNADGVAKVKMADAVQPVCFIGYNGTNVAYGSMASVYQPSGSHKTYFYTDKPVYRLGQKVFFKGIVREDSRDQLVNPGAGLAIPAEIDGPSGDKLWEGELKTNSFGAFNGSFNIPEDGKTGAYGLKLDYGGNDTSYCAFEIEEYRKPEYLVEVSALTPRVAVGEQAKAQIKATYFFGAPVANASVKYSIYATNDYQMRWRLEDRPSYFAFFDSWFAADDAYGAGGEMITSGTAQTDGNGLATVTFDTKKTDETATNDQPYDSGVSDKKYRVEAEVTDISRLTQVGSGSCEVTAGDFALFVKPRAYVVQTGEQIPIDVQAVDYDGKPVANQSVTISMSRWTYDGIAHQYKAAQKVADVTTKTGPDGKASTSIFSTDQWPSDTFSVSATAQDARGHKIYDRASVWVSNSKYAYQLDDDRAAKQTVSLTLDKEVYKPGDKAKIMIAGPLTGKENVTALVTIEGSKLYQHKVVPLKATATFVEFPITKDLAPNAFVDVAFVGPKHQLYTAEQMFKVSPEDHFLKIAVTSDKERYHPGDTVNYTIKATHADGSPAAHVDLSLGVVDESIYAIRAEQAEDIQKFFYARRNNAVQTLSSFPVLYSGGPDKIEPKVRKDFRDTAAWMPDLETDATGTVTAKVKLPDNLTTWRATVRGVDANLCVGSTTQKILCTQDFILRLALPRFFDEDDHGFITAIVHNYTKEKQPVRITLAASEQFSVETALTQNVDIDSEKAVRYSWPVTLTKAGMATIKAKAIGRTAGDAIEQKIPVRSLAFPAFTIRTGVLRDENAEVKIPLKMSGDAMPGTEVGELHVSGSTIGPVLGNFDKLILYPYGCTEQTMSRLVPSIVAMQLHKQLNLPIAHEDEVKFAKTQAAALDKLRGYHHADGGWGWWANDESNPYLTCYVVSGLSMLKEVDYAKEDALIRSGLLWLAKSAVEGHKQMTDPKLAPDPYHHLAVRTDMCRILYTLSEWSVTPLSMQQLSASGSLQAKKKNGSKPDTSKTQGDGPLHFRSQVLPIDFNSLPQAPKCDVRNWLVSQRNKLTPEALVYLTLACKNLHDDENAKLVYARLTELSQSKAGTVSWNHDSGMAKKLGIDYEDYDYRFTSTETTALALTAVLDMEPENLDKIENIKKWILLQRDQNGWQNTKTTSQVFLSLLKEELQFKSQQKQPSDFAVKAIGVGHELLDLMFNSTNIYAAETTTPLKPTADAQELDLIKSGPGRLYYTSILNYMRKLMPGDQIASKGVPTGLKITRKFYRLKATTGADGSIKFHSEEIADHQLKAGETIMMKTIVDSPVSLPYVKIEAALPSGGEVVKDSRESSVENPNESSTSEDGAKIEGDWSQPWWTHEDVLDDRIVYFGASLPQGQSEFHTMLRMELPGKFEVLPITLEGMYSDKIRGYSPLDELKVTE